MRRLPLWITDDKLRPRNVKWPAQGHASTPELGFKVSFALAPPPRGRGQLPKLVQHSTSWGEPLTAHSANVSLGQFWVTRTCKSTFMLYCSAQSHRNKCPVLRILAGRWRGQWGQSLRQRWAKSKQKRLWKQCCHLVRHVLAHLRDRLNTPNTGNLTMNYINFLRWIRGNRALSLSTVWS